MPSVFDLRIPYAELLGMRRLTEEPGRVTAALEVRPELTNSWGAAHGGAIMSLLDMTMGMSAKSLDPAANSCRPARRSAPAARWCSSKVR